MSRSFQDSVDEFRSHWRHYVLQSVAAYAATFAVFLFLTAQHAVIIASIGATAFIVFAMPASVTANPRNVIGGHVAALVVGTFVFYIPHQAPLTSAFVYSLAIGGSMLVMVVTDTEHPPAAGTALGLAMSGPSTRVTLTMVLSVAALSLIHDIFRPNLRDLV